MLVTNQKVVHTTQFRLLHLHPTFSFMIHLTTEHITCLSAGIVNPMLIPDIPNISSVGFGINMENS